jgi:hypothetical protein
MMGAFLLQIAHAQNIQSAQLSVLDSFLARFYLNVFVPIAIFLVALALLLFMWGMIEFIRGAGSEDAVTKGKQHMLWGIVGLTIMLSFWGIMRIICQFIGACII